MRLSFVFSVIASLVVPLQADFQGSTHMMQFEEDPIAYHKTADDSPIAKLQERVNSGRTTLLSDQDYGYLRSLLKELGISDRSQALVFSKTSFQRDRISPAQPRALYYSDDVYIGFIPGSPMIEISAASPKLGAVFYTLDQKPAGKPQFVRNDQCLECHASAKTMGVPGHVLRSFVTDESGAADLSTGVSQVNHRTPVAERWGGWFVTGKHGNQTHRGNLIGKDEFESAQTRLNLKGNVTDLSSLVDLSAYPRKTSDIVSLMVLEHQTHMHNFIARLGVEARIALGQFGHINYLKNQTEGFLKYLLFIEEAPLTAPLTGDPGFQADFVAQGPKDGKGRSLRDFDLKTRVFKNPCSYLIYSEAFDALPEPLRDSIYQKLFDILTGKNLKPEYAILSAETRRAILEILIATKKGLPDYWKLEA